MQLFCSCCCWYGSCCYSYSAVRIVAIGDGVAAAVTVAVAASTLGLAACDAVAYVAVDVVVAPIVAIVIKLNRKAWKAKKNF